VTTAPIEQPAAAPKRRRRVWPFLVIAIVLVVVIVGARVAESAARSYAQDRIRTQLLSSLGLPASTDVLVDFDSGSILLQALSGSLSAVDARVSNLSFGGLSGTAYVHATGVPLDTSKPTKTLEVDYVVTEANLAALGKNLSGVDVTAVTLEKSEIVAASSITVLGAKVPVSLGLTPSVADGRLVFTPTDIRIAGQTFTAEQLRANPLFGSLASGLLTQQSLCVAQYLPKALTPSVVQIANGSLIVSFSGHGAALGGPEFRTKGSCT
jgi:hypothetical protein